MVTHLCILFCLISFFFCLLSIHVRVYRWLWATVASFVGSSWINNKRCEVFVSACKMLIKYFKLQLITDYRIP